MTTLRIGVIGLGVISKFYLAAMDADPSVELVGVCDLREEALAPFRGRVDCYRDHRQLLDRPDLDAVVVNVPNDAHGTICRDALLRGRSVCVEKPLTVDLAEGRALAELARQQGLTLFTAFHRRYNTNVLALRDRLPSGVPIRSVTVRYLEKIEEHVGNDRWYLDMDRCGGGCVADNGPNAFDLARFLLGEVALERVNITRDADGVDRQAIVTLRAESGALATIELDWSYPHGEAKDVEVVLADGRIERADMLDGYDEFKGSLWHEYIGIFADFTEAVRQRADRAREGVLMLELVHEAYRAEAAGSTPGAPDPSLRRGNGLPAVPHPENGAKRLVEGPLVKVLVHRRDDRGMRLEPFASRCVRQGEIHELVTTDHRDTEPGARIDRVGFLGFVEIAAGGVIDRGDEVLIDGNVIGTVLGFDACHFPNHYNVLIATERTLTGPEIGLKPEAHVQFRAIDS
ncbi:MAG TPA: Gfo/Idh/MocA family oxidoreductase [Micromonospora sp.]|nr:Gfo/Idh/MocA family oxidoreductase [Micromonospora sp.]